MILNALENCMKAIPPPPGIKMNPKDLAGPRGWWSQGVIEHGTSLDRSLGRECGYCYQIISGSLQGHGPTGVWQ